MNCEEALLSISATLDGELSPQKRAELSRHLLECPSCRELAEDLRVLTDLLEDSDQEPPAELAEAIRRAVAEEPQTASVPKKRRPPYLRAVAAMLVLCVGLGGIGLFASGRMNGSADSAAGAAPALYQSDAAAGTEDGAAEGWAEPGGGVEKRISGYSMVTAGDGTENYGEAENPAQAGSSAEEDGELLMPGYDPSADGEAPGSEMDAFDGIPAEAPAGSYDGSKDGDAAVLTSEGALDLVFEYLGGYETYPEAERLSQDGTVLGCILKTVETDSDRSEWHLDYAGTPPEGDGFYFHFYKIVTKKQAEEPSTYAPTINWFTVSPAGELTAQYPE